MATSAGRATLNLNSVHGGLAEAETGYTGLPSALVPDSCRLVLDRRFPIEETLDEVRAELDALLEGVARERPGFEWTTRELFSVLPTLTPDDAPVVAAVSDAVRATLGREPERVVSPGTYDQKHIDRIGRLSNCLAYGPGILDLAHRSDEWVGIDDMVNAGRVMARTLAALLGR